LTEREEGVGPFTVSATLLAMSFEIDVDDPDLMVCIIDSENTRSNNRKKLSIR
jgi:hypothetical protein